MKRLIFGRNARESAANLRLFIDLNLVSIKFDLNGCDKFILDAAMAVIFLFDDRSLNQRICNYSFSCL